MILSDSSILSAIDEGDIVIEPYDRSCLGTNSYDVHLSPFLACYVDEVIDAKKHNQVDRFQIPEVGIVLEPGRTYLGSTVEYTETRRYVPFLEGSRVSAGWALTSMRRRERGTSGFATIGLWKSRFLNRSAFMRACRSAS